MKNVAKNVLPNLHTLHEAADIMKLKPRTLAKAARKIGACSVFGRDILLSDEDIQAVWEANRVAPTTKRVARTTPTFSSYQIEKRLKKLLAPSDKRRLKSRI